MSCPAACAGIHAWFEALRFVRLETQGCIAWYRASANLLVADAHEGNVIKTRDGALVPIDLNLVQPAGELHAWAMAQVAAARR